MSDKKTEIGSEFWDVPVKDRENGLFDKKTQWFLSGRSALQSIVKDLKQCRSVALPSWCCDSMIKRFVNAGIEIRFYPVYWQNGLVQEVCQSSEVLFLMDYFGYTLPQPDLTGYKGRVIRDVTHSLFSHSCPDADYCFGSLRKWCGVWTGGYAWTRDGHTLAIEQGDDCGYAALRKRAMQLKGEYINKVTNSTTEKKEYLSLFAAAEDVLESVGSAAAAERDVSAAHKLDVDRIRFSRRRNAEILRAEFTDWLVFPDLADTDCPMFVPIIVPDGRRDELRRYLIQHDIYCPIHWPVSEYHRLNPQEQMLYNGELSLVCDQRYSEDDMYRMAETIKSFWKEA